MGMKYNILQPIYRPHFNASGERERDDKNNAAYRVEFRVVGQCNSMEEAKKVCAVPVLEEVWK
jgi:hypothetical protein